MRRHCYAAHFLGRIELSSRSTRNSISHSIVVPTLHSVARAKGEVIPGGEFNWTIQFIQVGQLSSEDGSAVTRRSAVLLAVRTYASTLNRLGNGRVYTPFGAILIPLELVTPES